MDNKGILRRKKPHFFKFRLQEEEGFLLCNRLQEREYSLTELENLTLREVAYLKAKRLSAKTINFYIKNLTPDKLREFQEIYYKMLGLVSDLLITKFQLPYQSVIKYRELLKDNIERAELLEEYRRVVNLYDVGEEKITRLREYYHPNGEPTTKLFKLYTDIVSNRKNLIEMYSLTFGYTDAIEEFVEANNLEDALNPILTAQLRSLFFVPKAEEIVIPECVLSLLDSVKREELVFPDICTIEHLETIYNDIKNLLNNSALYVNWH